MTSRSLISAICLNTAKTPRVNQFQVGTQQQRRPFFWYCMSCILLNVNTLLCAGIEEEKFEEVGMFCLKKAITGSDNSANLTKDCLISLKLLPG